MGPLKSERLSSPPEDEPSELTGFDADPSEATFGEAGNGASPFGADLAGGFVELEEEPSGADISPDQVEEPSEEGPEVDEDQLTARPTRKLDRERLEQGVEDAEDTRPELSNPEMELP